MSVATHHAAREPRRQLRLLSFNIQAGFSIENYRHYVTKGLQHVLPHPDKRRNLGEIAGLVANYDFVALQEADAGSLRSGFQNQIQYLADKANFPFWSHQSNRKVVRVAEPSNGALSRFEPVAVIAHRLPGAIPGRGALEVRLGNAGHELRIFIAHLALTPSGRRRQIGYLSEAIGKHPYVALMGDLNCTVEGGELRPIFAHTRLVPPTVAVNTFPSWRPLRAIDHILVSEALKPISLEVPILRVSDHLPVALTVELPKSLRLL